jgi:hypothetical protein
MLFSGLDRLSCPVDFCSFGLLVCKGFGVLLFAAVILLYLQFWFVSLQGLW